MPSQQALRLSVMNWRELQLQPDFVSFGIRLVASIIRRRYQSDIYESHSWRSVMPVLTLECPDCGHRFQGLVLAGTRPPEEWVCSKCGSRKAKVMPDKEPIPHPWEGEHGVGLCPCCN